MIVKRIGPLSLAKLSGLLYAIMGLVLGGFFAAISVLGGAALNQGSSGALPSVFFGVGAVIILPILYGGLGFLGSLLMAALYNFFAGLVGGIELHLEHASSSGTPGQAV